MIPWKNWRNLIKATLLCLVAANTAWGQGVAHYIDLAYQGKVEEVRAALPGLKKQQPNDGAILFLEGLVTIDGDKAVEMFNKVVQLYPSNPYADDALLKIGEFLYSRGLYIQAAQQLKRIPVHYPRSELVHSSIRLFLNALLVSGDRDTALFYADVFARKYPKIKFDLQAGKVVVVPEARNPNPPAGRVTMATPEDVSRYQLQVGAYSSQENASRQRDLLQSLNYRVAMRRITTDNRVLYAVIVSGFISPEEARRVGEELKRDYGLDYLVQRTE
ncbi:MAG: SPOR domain-containing protein [Candidatus Neomarinimicrobiota bacterium]